MSDEERDLMIKQLENRGFVYIQVDGSRLMMFDMEQSMTNINSNFKHTPFVSHERLFDYFTTMAKYISYKYNLSLHYREDEGMGIGICLLNMG
jgi:hypothetical protein